jgi:iron complex outermembrane receptor protein
MTVGTGMPARRSLLLAAAGLTTVISWSTVAQAQAPGARAQTGSQAASMTTLQEVVVTAQRRTQNLQDVPVSVQAVTSKDMQAAGIKAAQDLGQITPNVTIVP